MINITAVTKKLKAFILLMSLAGSTSVFAQTESYIQTLTGVIKPKDVCVAVDEKFASAELWSAIKKNIVVQNVITFEVRYDTTINFFGKSFDCELLADISYKDSAMREKKLTDVKLTIHYDTAKGKAYKGIAYYKFAGGHEVTVTVKSITSKEIDITKAAFLRIKNQILIDRTYKKREGNKEAEMISKFVKNPKVDAKNSSSPNFGGTVFNGNRQILISWASEFFEYDKYDFEYTFYDANSYLAAHNFSTGTVNQAVLEEAFKNNSTRVSLDNPEYVLNLVYPTGYLLVRIRAYTYNEVDGEMDREEFDWHYIDPNGIGGFAVYAIAEHENNLSWQYSAAFAEEGKRKEVVSYFDGGLKSRQSVTISNSDNVSIVAENVLDKQNRPAVSVLPVPTDDNTIHFFPAFNRNNAGTFYSYANFNASNLCVSNAAPMSTSFGASRYYSANNPFAGNTNYPFAKDISKDVPDAGGYPFAVTEFTNDQTGRIRRQGGVGSAFQLGGGKETSYYYGKPAQEELDRLFGSEAGAAAHYSKNMVVDANGQVSISYVDIAGKTVATSLAGSSPANLSPLESSANTVRLIKDELVRPQGLVRDADNLKVSFNSTVMVPAAASYNFKYEFSGRSLELIFGFNPEKKVCADCYYDVKLSISDECGATIPLTLNGTSYPEILVPAAFNYGNSTSTTPPHPNTQCGVVLPTQMGNVTAAFPKTGEYKVSYQLIMSRKALDYYMEYLKQLQVMKTEDEFKKDYLKRIDLTGCFSDCRDCRVKLGTVESFIERMRKVLLEEDNVIVTTDDIEWITQLYNATLIKCGQAETVGKNCSITDACKDQRRLMLKDLTPGGQYMLYDETTLLFKERLTNVFVSKIAGNSAITDMVTINRNGTEQTVLFNSLQESEVITQWNPDWAYLMLPQHPEACLLQECESQSNSKNRDRAMLQTDDDVEARNTYLWKREEANFTSFVNAEMALVTAPYVVSGIRSYIEGKIQSFITGVPIKTASGIATGNISLRDFIRFMVYCPDASKPPLDPATSQFPFIDMTCVPASPACDKPLEEWRMFRNLYFAIKQEAYRKPGNKTTSESCKNCYIGVNVFSSTYNEKADPNYYPKLKEFFIQENSSHTGLEVVFNQQTPINNRCDVYVAKASIVGGVVTAVPVETLHFQENGSNVLPIATVNMNEKDLYFVEHIINNYNHNIDGTNPPSNVPNWGDFQFDGVGTHSLYLKITGKYPLLNKTNIWYKIRLHHCPNDDWTNRDIDPLEAGPIGLRVGSSCEMLDPEMGAITNINTLASCISDSRWPLYFQKTRRFYESSSVEDIQTVLNESNNGTGTNPMGGENYQQNAQDLSEGWLETLKGCFTGPTDPKREQLRTRMIAVCVAGSDMLHPFGSSSTKNNIPTTYGDKNFQDAIIGVLGAETETCSALLIDFPLAYDSKSPINDEIVTKLSACGYSLLTRFKTEWQNAGGPNTLYPTLRDYIRKKYDPNFYLTDKQMDELLTTYVSGCPVKRPFKIPGILTRCADPKTPTCLKCSQLYNVQQQFHAAYPQFPETLENYYTLLAGYINQVYQMHVSPTALHDAINKCKNGGIFDDGCGNRCNEVIANLQKFYQVMPLTEYYNKVYCEELNCEDVLAVFRNHITTWLNITMGMNHDFNYYYNNYFDSCAIEYYQEPGCYYFNKYKQGLANGSNPCQCPYPNVLRCCDTYAPFVTFRNLYPNPVDPKLMAFFFEMRRYTVCAPTNLPNISYTLPYGTLINYFNNLVPNVIANCSGSQDIIAKRNASTGNAALPELNKASLQKKNIIAKSTNPSDTSNVCAGPISGNVWHDVNGMNDGYVNNSGASSTPPAAAIPSGLYAYIIYTSNVGLPTDKVGYVTTVNSTTGAYSFGNIVCGYYRIYLSSVLANVGDPPPPTSLPAGWEHTGQNYGLGAGDDGTNDGILPIPYGAGTNANFGIRIASAQSSCSSVWTFTYDTTGHHCPDIYDPVFGPGDFVLCSQPLTPVYTSDSNECIRSMVNASLANAEYAYSEYVKDFMRDYREAYFAKCMSITPSLVMEGNQQEYHYTLYYYDQSGNLVKTIPPKGVTYLSETQIMETGRLRDEDNGECYKNSTAPTFAGTNQSFSVPAGFYPKHDAGALTVETWVKFADINNKQVILNQFDDGGSAVGKAGYYAYIENGKLYFNIFGRSQETWEEKHVHWLYASLLPNVQAHYYDVIQEHPRVRVFRASCSTENLVSSSGPADKFYHIVFQYSGDPQDTRPVKIYVNGILQTLNWTTGGNGYEYHFADNLADVAYAPIPTILETKYELKTVNTAFTTASATPLVAGSTTRTVNGVNMNGISGGSMKHLRIYNAAPDAADLRRSSYDACFVPSTKNGLVLWLPLNKQTGGLTEDVQSGDNVPITATWANPAVPQYPLHKMPTYYAYNSLNQVSKQQTPDAGESKFWYDRLGRLVVSQNAEQKVPSNSDYANRYSYTRYDQQGRITEVGEKVETADISLTDTKNDSQLRDWMEQGTDRQVTRTIYDNPDPFITTNSQILLQQLHHYNSRKRVVTSIYIENKGARDEYNYATHYIYDISGNVKRLYQENRKLPNGTEVNKTKTLDYEFDLVSGKVNQVWYQKEKQDQYLYKYMYDGDNRIVDAQSGRDIATLRYDARYRYYLHGPLARTELGHDIVQGVDYAYTLQGWLKGINGLFLNDERDPSHNYDLGGDAVPGTARALIPADIYGYTLGYYANDYTPIDNRGGQHPISLKQFGFNSGSGGATGYQLFNGNIAYTSYANRALARNTVQPNTYSYKYDQLNRLVEMRSHDPLAPSGTWNSTTTQQDYAESVTYDANGNILSYNRNGMGIQSTGINYDMDKLTYHYIDPDNNNKLGYVTDLVATGIYNEDIDDQSSGNYTYDKIGNLISDASGDKPIDEIKWTVYGKIKSIHKNDGTLIEYAYDPAGNRISKTVGGADLPKTTFYYRDATGNTMAVYETQEKAIGLLWTEQDLYGSSRLGTWSPDMIIEDEGDGGCPGCLPPPPCEGCTIYPNGRSVSPMVTSKEPGTATTEGTGTGTDGPKGGGYDETIIGTRHYELTNHLGNVMATISDMKTGVDGDGDNNIDYYIADVITANDYYPFGMSMPDRKYTSGSEYRYGFNGKEKDKEIGEGDLEYGERIYDGRLSRWLSVDPLAKNYPMLSNYSFVGGNPNFFIEIDGRYFLGVDGNKVQIEKREGKLVILSTNASSDIIKLVNMVNNAGSPTAVDQIFETSINSTKIHVKIETKVVANGLFGLHQAHDKDGNILEWDDAKGDFNGTPAYVEGEEGVYSEATITIFEGNIKASGDDNPLGYGNSWEKDIKLSADEAEAAVFSHETNHDTDKEFIQDLKNKREGKPNNNIKPHDNIKPKEEKVWKEMDDANKDPKKKN